MVAKHTLPDVNCMFGFGLHGKQKKSFIFASSNRENNLELCVILNALCKKKKKKSCPFIIVVFCVFVFFFSLFSNLTCMAAQI